MHRPLKAASRTLVFDPADYGTHSMRPIKATLIHLRTKNLRAVQLLLGHLKPESTVSYLAIEVDDALKIFEQTQTYGLVTVARWLKQYEATKRLNLT